MCVCVLSPQKAGVGDEERKERVRELEERLEESAQQRETLAEEVDRLTASVEQVTEHKTKADETIDQVYTYMYIV